MTESGSVSIRPLRTADELRACVTLQEATWGEGFAERVPVSLLKVAARLGGVVSGAFDDGGRQVGFVFGLTGVEEGRLVHWSDMLAVAPELRDAGVGRRLKVHQRERLLAMGVTRMRWTFDPLESRNAHLNLGVLGAVCGEYAVDMYGASDSPLHQGLGTDRFVTTWDMDSDRVEARLGGRRFDPSATEEAMGPDAFGVRASGAGPAPVDVPHALPDAPVFRVAIPADIQGLKAADAGLALAWRHATRAALEPALARGGVARELVRAGPVSHYLVYLP